MNRITLVLLIVALAGELLGLLDVLRVDLHLDSRSIGQEETQR